ARRAARELDVAANGRVSRLAWDAYPTLEAVHTALLNFHRARPDYVSPVEVIGSSYGGRPLWAQRIGAPAAFAPAGDGVDGEGVHGVLLTGMHHGREPMGMLTALYYAELLLQRLHDQDAHALALLSRTCVHIVPALNPDAYEVNLKHSDYSRRMARKNRRPGCQSVYESDVGVDLNRNYDFAWNIDDEGSTNVLCDEAYRGTAPFSEPETAALAQYVQQHQLSTALNYHSFGQFINVPYAAKPRGLPQPNVFKHVLALAEAMSAVTGFGFGQPWAGTLYSVNGEASDWMLEARGVYAFSPELGPHMNEEFVRGMWPPAHMMLEIIEQGARMTHVVHERSVATLGLNHTHVSVNSVQGVDGATSQRLSLATVITNTGVRDTHGDVSLTLAPLTELVSHEACDWPGATPVHSAGVGKLCRLSLLTVFNVSADGGLLNAAAGVQQPYSCSAREPSMPVAAASPASAAARNLIVSSSAQLRTVPAWLESFASSIAAVPAPRNASSAHADRLDFRPLLESARRLYPSSVEGDAASGVMLGHGTIVLGSSVALDALAASTAAQAVLDTVPASSSSIPVTLQVVAPQCAPSTASPLAVLGIADARFCALYFISCDGQLSAPVLMQSGCAPCRLLRTGSWRAQSNNSSPNSNNPPAGSGAGEPPDATPQITSKVWPWMLVDGESAQQALNLQAAVFFVAIALGITFVCLWRTGVIGRLCARASAAVAKRRCCTAQRTAYTPVALPQ
ncbi:hypothetical protein EON62_00820, partial [archaeon]